MPAPLGARRKEGVWRDRAAVEPWANLYELGCLRKVN